MRLWGILDLTSQWRTEEEKPRGDHSDVMIWDVAYFSDLRIHHHRAPASGAVTTSYCTLLLTT